VIQCPSPATATAINFKGSTMEAGIKSRTNDGRKGFSCQPLHHSLRRRAPGASFGFSVVLCPHLG
jgi:hypothetical protein